MSKAELKTCPRCHQVFECHSSAMFLCQCNNVDLPEEVVEQLTDKYDDCLCLSCLEEILKSGKI